MIYTLKIYDTELMTFALTQKPLEGFCCQIISVSDGCASFTFIISAIITLLKSSVHKEIVPHLRNNVKQGCGIMSS